MKIPTEGKLLRIFVGEADRWVFLPPLEKMVKEGLIPLEKAHVVMYRANG